MARRTRRPASRAANWRVAGLLRGRYGWAVRIAALIAVAVAGVGEVRQSEWFYPVVQPFDRSLYRHWVDADGDCQDTRTEVLIQESLEPVGLSADGCTVARGRWYDPYTDQSFTEPRDLDVDHRIPLAEAHRSGADRWDPARRQAFANDLSHPDTLIGVDRSANRSKADGDPLSWLPSAWGYRCRYVERWRETKQRWGLGEDLLEGWWIDGIGWMCRHLGD
ncbi:HNH endonuclease [Thalassobaculum sp.]|uniref:HNH endonuclease n=1 Tax=Thalassobaculum sp. TaxID=2022740 RepID=UPI0032EFE5AB